MPFDRPDRCAGSSDWTERIGRKILAADDHQIRRLFPEFRLIASLPGQSIWEGPLQPFAQPYLVRLGWSLNVRGSVIRSSYSSPTITVLDPPLVRRPGNPDSSIPHLYRQPSDHLAAKLCLYWPDGVEFNSAKYLADTVLPWASEWLGYYELWHVTGEWFGPEAPHVTCEPVESSPPNSEIMNGLVKLRAPSGSVLSAHPYLVHTYHPVPNSNFSSIAA
ncbi:MAG: hypothetical protein V4502_06500 [Pseudomonadota bacterium]